jgi:hypothetical protein
MSVDPQAQATASGGCPNRSSVHEHDAERSKANQRPASKVRERVIRTIKPKEKRDDDAAARLD